MVDPDDYHSETDRLPIGGWFVALVFAACPIWGALIAWWLL